MTAGVGPNRLAILAAPAELAEPEPVASTAQETAQAFMTAVGGGADDLALKYGTADAIASYWDQAQESGAYLAEECQDLDAQTAARVGGEVYCPFTGQFSTLDLALHFDGVQFVVVGAFGGFLE